MSNTDSQLATRQPKVLVIGATGYLGSAILNILNERGIDHVGTSRSPAQTEGWVACNILDVESIRHAIESTGATHIIHTAGMVSHSHEDADRLWKIHVQGTENVCSVALELNIERVVYLSTSGTIAVSEDADVIPDENSPSPFATITQWPYYRSKYFAEQVALDFVKKGLPLICLNPSRLLGAGDGGESTKSVELFLDDKIPLAPCGGIAFVDVQDVAQTVVAALSQGTIGERYLLNAANMTFMEYYGRIARLSDKPAPLMKMPDITRKALSWFPGLNKVGLHLDKSDVEIASYFWYANAEKAQQELAFRPRDPMDTLLDTVEELQKDDFQFFG
jgi:dihydroflavonol-4-reductase